MAATIASPAALSVLGMGGRVSSSSSSTSSSKLAAKVGKWKGTRAAADPEATWQVAVGALGIEFSKRIGGLPWQSWKRFFTG